MFNLPEVKSILNLSLWWITVVCVSSHDVQKLKRCLVLDLETLCELFRMPNETDNFLFLELQQNLVLKRTLIPSGIHYQTQTSCNFLVCCLAFVSIHSIYYILFYGHIHSAAFVMYLQSVLVLFPFTTACKPSCLMGDIKNWLFLCGSQFLADWSEVSMFCLKLQAVRGFLLAKESDTLHSYEKASKTF